MSGVKRRSGYRKNVTEDVLYGMREPTEHQQIVQVLKSLGSNLLQVETSAGDDGIAMLPTKFRKLVWIKRGNFAIVSQAEGGFETASGSEGKVRYIIDHVLYSDAIKNLQQNGKWPERFATDALKPQPSAAAEAANADVEGAAARDGGEDEHSNSDTDESTGSEEDEDVFGRGRRGHGGRVRPGQQRASAMFGRPGELPPADAGDEYEDEGEQEEEKQDAAGNTIKR